MSRKLLLIILLGVVGIAGFSFVLASGFQEGSPPSPDAQEPSKANSAEKDEPATKGTDSEKASNTQNSGEKSPDSNMEKNQKEANDGTAPSPAGNQVTPAQTQPKSDQNQTKEDGNSLAIEGIGVAQSLNLSFNEIKKMGQETYTYFSRGKDPKEAYNTFTGIQLITLLQKAGLKDDAKKVKIIGADGYSASFSLSAVKELRIDETDASKKLPMLIAFSEDGNQLAKDSIPCKLVMGQEFEGDYNRQYWVKKVVKIVVE